MFVWSLVEVTDKTDCGVRVANFTGHIERRDHIIAQPLSYNINVQQKQNWFMEIKLPVKFIMFMVKKLISYFTSRDIQVIPDQTKNWRNVSTFCPEAIS